MDKQFQVYITEEKAKYLERLSEDIFDLTDINGLGCPWWNVSCHLGNRGSVCTISVECMPSCN